MLAHCIDQDARKAVHGLRGIQRGAALPSMDLIPVSYTHLTLPTIYSV